MYRLGLTGFTVLRSVAILLTTLAIVLLADHVARRHGARLGMTAAALLLLTPMVAHYGRMYHAHTWLLLWMVLMVRAWSAPDKYDRDSRRVEHRRGWRLGLAVAGPLMTPLASPYLGVLALVWWRRGVGARTARLVDGGLLLVWAVLGFLIQIWMVEAYYGTTDVLLNRVGARSEAGSWTKSVTWEILADRYVSLFGVATLFIGTGWLAWRGRRVRAVDGPWHAPTGDELAALPILAGGLGITVLFTEPVVACCPYLLNTVPLGLVLLFPAMWRAIDLRWLAPVLIAALMLTAPMYEPWNDGQARLYLEPLQEHIITEIADDPEALVIIDQQLVAWTSTRMLLPNGSINLRQNQDPARILELVELRGVDHILVTNETNDLWLLQTNLPALGWCDTEIDSLPETPDYWRDGWMRKLVPFHDWTPCSEVGG